MSSQPANHNSLFNKALHNHQCGRLQEAEQIYRSILEIEADHADALHLLGLIAHQTHQDEKAASLINRAIECSPDTAMFHCSLGGVFQARGNYSRAIACYQKAIELDPNYFEAMYNLANAFQILHRFQEAIRSYRSALKLNPEVAEVHFNLGSAYHQTKNFQEALAAYQKAVKIQPAYADAYNSMGNVYQNLDMPEMGLQSYQRALEINPDFAEAFYNTGNLHQKMGNFKQAVLNYQTSLAINDSRADTYSNLGHAYLMMECYEDAVMALRKAVDIEPGDAEYHFNLGNSFLQQDRFAEAIDCYRTALDIVPDYYDALINLGNALQKSMRFEEARASFYKAIECEPQSPMAYNNLGKAYQDQGDYRNARCFYQKALELRPDYAEAHFNHAFTLLMLGEFAAGWQEYEWRFKRAEWQKTYPHRLQTPRWVGSSFAGKRLLVHCEQGFGDTLQFVRYLPMVKARGGTLIFEAVPQLSNLLKNHPAIDELVEFDLDRPPTIHFDLYCPLLSLPEIFGTDLTSIPAAVPYLQPDSGRSLLWSKKIAESCFKIGLVWAGSPTDPNRSCSLAGFYPLAKIPGIRLYGLQKGAAVGQTKQLPGGMEVTNLGEAFEDFSDTAAAIENLDLVITIDTAVAHLAGAMGKPVWVLLPFAADWRWQLDREDSPWYPTMKLYRQSKRGDWQTVCRRIAADLENEVTRGDLPAGKSDAALERNEDAPDYSSDRNKAAENPARNFNPDPVSAHRQGISAYQAGDYNLACTWIEKALDRDYENPLCHYDLGIVLIALGRIDDAILSFQQAVRLKPEYSEALFNLGLALKKQGQLDAARSSFDRVLQLNPKDAEAHYNAGNILKTQEKLEEAESRYQQALKLTPTYAEAFNNLGLVLKEKGIIEAAIEKYQQAINLKPGFAEAHWNLALAQLLNGNYAAGWAEYDWRFKRGKWTSTQRWPGDKPIWDGSSFKGRRLLIWGEQGFGDNLQFIRYLPLVKSRGGTVIFETNPALHAILQDFPGIDEFNTPGLNNQSQPHHDLYAPLMSLPRLFHTSLDTIPAAVPYLHAPAGKAKYWRNRIAEDGLRAGIVWAGRPQHENDANRSVALKQFIPLIEMDGLHVYGLQKGAAALEATRLASGTNFKNLGEELDDFADTAGLIENLDLVITVDTSVAHLAGAMAKPVWVLLPHIPDWRWLMQREDSPWYPTMRLFRSPTHGNWEPVFQQIKKELELRLEMGRQN